MIIDIKDLRGYKQPGFFPGWIAWIKNLAMNDMLYLSEVLSYINHREVEAEQIAWVNAMPDSLYKSLDPIEMHFAFERRNPSLYLANYLADPLSSKRPYFGTSPYWFAKKIDRRVRHNEIHMRWEIRKNARTLSATTPSAAAPARVSRL